MNAADQAVLAATDETDAALLAQLEVELAALPRPRAAAWDLDGIGGDQWAVRLHEQRRAAEDRAFAERDALDRARRGATGWLTAAARAADRIVRRQAARAWLAEHNARRRALASYPLTDVDIAAVDALMSGRLPWGTHAEHRQPRPSGRHAGQVATARIEHARERLTRQGEQWLAVHLLLRHHTAPKVAAILGTSPRQIGRWIARRALGWPTGPGAHLLPRDLTRHRPTGTSEWAWRLIAGASGGTRTDHTDPDPDTGLDEWAGPTDAELAELDEAAA